jgi:hypothetical protein
LDTYRRVDESARRYTQGNYRNILDLYTLPTELQEAWKSGDISMDMRFDQVSCADKNQQSRLSLQVENFFAQHVLS